jgi:hypothetical protein
VALADILLNGLQVAQMVRIEGSLSLVGCCKMTEAMQGSALDSVPASFLPVCCRQACLLSWDDLGLIPT